MAALDNIASELLKSANEADLIYKKTRDQAQRDKAVRLRRIVENLKLIIADGLTPTLDEVLAVGNTSTNSLDVGGITTDYVQLDTAATPTLAPGMFAWNDAYGTADLRLKGNNVTLQLGQETLARVVNKTGSDLLESQYKVVRVRVASEGGAQGQRLAVVLAQGLNDPESATTLGIVTENIVNNQEGFITVFGNVNNINTTGSLQGETWVDGDVLYLSPTTAGGLTKVKPVAPNHMVIIGYVVYAHAVNGKIFVKVDNGYELDELHNVLINGVANNDLLQYDSVTQVWKNKSISTIFGGTPLVSVPTLAQVTTAGNTTTNAITVGGVTSTGAAYFQNEINALWGVGELTFNRGSANLTPTLAVGNTNPGGKFAALLAGTNGSAFVYDAAGYFTIGSEPKANYTSRTLGGSSTTRLQIFGSTGNVTINSTTDAGYRLDVNGTARVQGTTTITPAVNTSAIVSTGYSVTGSGTTPLIDLSGTWNTTGIVNALRINITNTASSTASNLINLQVGGNTLFRVNASSISGITTGGPIAANGYGLGNGSAGIFTVDGTGAYTSTGTSMKFSDGLTDVGYSYIFESGQYSNKTFTSGTGGFIWVKRNFAPVSGTGVFNILHLQNTINQTGGANGITRGLYIQPTLTAAADWRAIESTNGRWVLTDTYSAGSGSLANPTLDISATWNTTGIPTLIKANVTDTASNASSFLIDLQVAGSSQFRVRKDGYARASQGFVIGTSNGNDLVSSSGGEAYVAGGLFTSLRFASSSTEGYGLTISGFNASTRTNTSGAAGVLQLAHGFAPTSGVGTFIGLLYRGTINQTGGASGVTRGLYVNPTLTAAADWRSIEWSNNSGWGLYGVGTAINYLNGALLIGTTANAGYKLDVNGTARIQSDLTVASLTTDGPVKSVSGMLVSVAGYTGSFTVPTNPPGMQTLDIQDGIIVNIL